MGSGDESDADGAVGGFAVGSGVLATGPRAAKKKSRELPLHHQAIDFRADRGKLIIQVTSQKL